MTKQQQLDQIAKDIAKCRICKQDKSGKPVAGEGNPNANIVFIGEAPGRTESETGKPFIGRSGQYLTKLLESVGLDRKDVYITSPVKYYPGMPARKLPYGIMRLAGGRTPNDSEIAHGKTHLDKQLAIIKPKIIVLLGQVAAKALVGKPQPLKNTHGKVKRINERIYFFTYHPAAAIRFQKNRKLIEEDFKKLKQLVSE